MYGDGKSNVSNLEIKAKTRQHDMVPLTIISAEKRHFDDASVSA